MSKKCTQNQKIIQKKYKTKITYLYLLTYGQYIVLENVHILVMIIIKKDTMTFAILALVIADDTSRDGFDWSLMIRIEVVQLGLPHNQIFSFFNLN